MIAELKKLIKKDLKDLEKETGFKYNYDFIITDIFKEFLNNVK